MRRLRPGVRGAIAFFVMLLTAAPARAQDDATELSKQTQNPVADLISVPLQNNWFGNAGPKERTVYNLNIEPVIPLHLTDNWNVITRVIIPIINLRSVDEAGLGALQALRARGIVLTGTSPYFRLLLGAEEASEPRARPKMPRGDTGVRRSPRKQ